MCLRSFMQNNIRQLDVTTRSGRGGTAVRRNMTIETYTGIEYEFYIPAANMESSGCLPVPGGVAERGEGRNNLQGHHRHLAGDN
jgi:hypothetical protein